MARTSVSEEELARYRARSREAVRRDGAVCLECGARRKSLGHHVRAHGMSLRAYRSKWGYPRHLPLIVHGIPNVDPPRPTRRVSAQELARYRGHFREAAQADGVVCLECGRIFRRLAAHLVKHQMGIADYREKWGYRRNTPLMTADLLEQKRKWAVGKNLAGFAPPGILRKAHAVLRRGRPPVRLETRLNKRDYGRALAARGWRPPNLKVPAHVLRRLVRQGLTEREISERTGLRRPNVWRRLQALGLRAAPPSPRPLVSARDAELLSLRQAGLWNEEIAQRTGMKPDAVSARFERMRKRGVRVPTPERPVPTPRRKVSDETLLALLRDGLRAGEIAARRGLHPSTVRVRVRALRRRGLWPGRARRKRGRVPAVRKPRGGSPTSAAPRKSPRRRPARHRAPITRSETGEG